MRSTAVSLLPTSLSSSCRLLLHLSLFLFLLHRIDGQENNDVIVDDGGSSQQNDSSAATYLILLCCAWVWFAGRKMAIHGLDFIIRQPETLAFIMMVMYLIAWGLVELSFSASGGYDPKMKSFGNGGNGDSFTMYLIIFSASLCVILTFSCSKFADRYSTFAQERKMAKTRAKNPYADRPNKIIKPLSTFLTVFFCTCCGDGATEEDGLDAEQQNKNVKAQMLTPPPAPTDQEYDAGLKALDDYKKEREADKDLNIVANIKSHIVGAEHQVEDLIHGVQHVSHNVAKNIQTKTNEASIRMEKATHI